MKFLGLTCNAALRAALLTAATMLAVVPGAVRADNCPRGSKNCPQASAPSPRPAPAPPPQPAARVPAPSAPAPTVRQQTPAPAQGQAPARPNPQTAAPPPSYPQPSRSAPYAQPNSPGMRAPQYSQSYQQYQQAQRGPQVAPTREPPRAGQPALQQPPTPAQSAQHESQHAGRDAPGLHPSESPAVHAQAAPSQAQAQAASSRLPAHEPAPPMHAAVSNARELPPRHEAAPRRDVPTQLVQHQVQLTPSAALVTHPGHAGFTAVDHESPRASIVVEQRTARGGRADVSAYRQTVSADGHTTTRLYADGRRSVETAAFRSTGHLGGPQFVRYHTGLRAAYMPDGHPLYAERFTTINPPGAARGRPARIVERTVYATDTGGRFTPLSRPVRRYYTVTPVGGYDTYVYRPRAFDPAFFPLFYTPLAAAILIGPQCLVCPAPVVTFAAAPVRYSDPIELLGDMQVADAVTDQGIAPIDAPADAAGVPPDDSQPEAAPADGPEPPPVSAPAQVTESADASAANVEAVANVRERAEMLRKKAAEKAPAATPESAPSPMEPAAPAVTLQQVSLRTDVDDAKINVLPVPDDVREQIHKQVRLSIAQHANDHPLALTEVMHSGYSRIFLFQVAAPLDTVSLVTGDACALGSGDLIAFATEADAAARPSAQMKVVAARPGHCLREDTIDVSVGDLQDMLNTFNERLEGNMRRLQSCMAAKDGCVRT